MKKFFDFEGRIDRTKYLILTLVANFTLPLIILSSIFLVNDFLSNPLVMYAYMTIVAIVGMISISLQLSAMSKRLHDFNKDGIYVFLLLLPVVNIIFMLVLFFKEGDIDENQYGHINNGY